MFLTKAVRLVHSVYNNSNRSPTTINFTGASGYSNYTYVHCRFGRDNHMWQAWIEWPNTSPFMAMALDNIIFVQGRLFPMPAKGFRIQKMAFSTEYLVSGEISAEALPVWKRVWESSKSSPCYRFYQKTQIAMWLTSSACGGRWGEWGSRGTALFTTLTQSFARTFSCNSQLHNLSKVSGESVKTNGERVSVK